MIIYGKRPPKINFEKRLKYIYPYGFKRGWQRKPDPSYQLKTTYDDLVNAIQQDLLRCRPYADDLEVATFLPRAQKMASTILQYLPSEYHENLDEIVCNRPISPIMVCYEQTLKDIARTSLSSNMLDILYIMALCYEDTDSTTDF